ncbi:MAG: HAD family hydrolase [Candidatus Eisenbacteria bacterium]
MRIEACIFDLFGTIVPVSRMADYYGTLDAVPARLGIDAAVFRREWDATYRERNDGRLPTLEANVVEICARLGEKARPAEMTASLAPFRSLIRETLNPKPESEALLRELARRGYPLGLISNCNPDVPGLFRSGPLASYFRETIFSSEVGMAKPEPGIYLEMIRRLAVRPEACLYVGDGHGRELAGAGAVGLITALLDNGQPDGYVFDQDTTADYELADLGAALGLLAKLERENRPFEGPVQRPAPASPETAPGISSARRA